MLSKILKLCLSFLIITLTINAQQFIKNEKFSGSIKDKFTTVFNSAKKNDKFWIGYSIERNDKKIISAGSFFYSNDSILNLGELIDGKISYEQYLNSSAKTYNISIIGHSIQIDNNQNKNNKDNRTALLFRYDASSKNISDIAEISVCHFSHSVDLDGSSLYWLGESSTDKSVNFVMDLYGSTTNNFIKEELIPAISAHNDQPKVTPFLKNVFYNSTNEDLREDVIFWIGLQNNSEAFQILKDIVNNESSEFGERAVYAMTNIESEEALNEIIRIAKSAHNREVREHAINALGSKAVNKAEAALKGFIHDDPDVEIKKSAIYALANGENDYLPYLIELAKTHPSLEIRKTAIYSISNYEDERAVDALIDLVQK